MLRVRLALRGSIHVLVQLIQVFLMLLNLFSQRLQLLILLLPDVQSLAGVFTFGEGITVGKSSCQ